VAFPTNVISPTSSPPEFTHVLFAMSQLAKPAAERPVVPDPLENTCVKLPATLRRPFSWFKEVTGPSTPPPSGDQVFPLMLYCAMYRRVDRVVRGSFKVATNKEAVSVQNEGGDGSVQPILCEDGECVGLERDDVRGLVGERKFASEEERIRGVWRNGVDSRRGGVVKLREELL
jgi:hypothetical protein